MRYIFKKYWVAIVVFALLFSFAAMKVGELTAPNAGLLPYVVFIYLFLNASELTQGLVSLFMEKQETKPTGEKEG